MLYELVTLSCPLLSLAAAASAAKRWIEAEEARGELLGAWHSDLGMLGKVLILLGFSTPEDMTAERRRALLAPDPFNAGEAVTGLQMESYAGFPFLDPARPASLGGIYEFRTYRLKPAGLAPTLAGWERAVAPARAYTQHLVVNMYALDGAPRITHIWGFASLEERARLRAAAYGAGLWPPQGGPDQILEAVATIGIPETWSPLS